MADEVSPKKPFMTRVELLILISVVAVLAALLFPAVRAARIAADRAGRRNKFRQLGMAFYNFYDVYQKLPSAVRTDQEGHPLSSWRFQIMPFSEAIMRDVDLGMAWDDPDNEFNAFGWSLFCYRYQRKGPERLCTNVVAVVGADTAFDLEQETYSRIFRTT